MAQIAVARHNCCMDWRKVRDAASYMRCTCSNAAAASENRWEVKNGGTFFMRYCAWIGALASGGLGRTATLGFTQRPDADICGIIGTTLSSPTARPARARSQRFPLCRNRIPIPAMGGR